MLLCLGQNLLLRILTTTNCTKTKLEVLSEINSREIWYTKYGYCNICTDIQLLQGNSKYRVLYIYRNITVKLYIFTSITVSSKILTILLIIQNTASTQWVKLLINVGYLANICTYTESTHLKNQIWQECLENIA